MPYQIGVIGAGYVGLTTAACLSHLGHDVVCADVDEEPAPRGSEAPSSLPSPDRGTMPHRKGDTVKAVKPLKVVHVHRSSGIGGSERHLMELATQQQRRGYEVHVVVPAPTARQPMVAELTRRGVSAQIVLHHTDASPLLVSRLTEIIAARRPQVVHTHLIHADLHGQLSARRCGVPGVSSVHSAHRFYGHFPFRSAARFAGRLARETIAISGYVAGFLEILEVVPAERVRVVPYGLDPTRWDPARVDRRQCRASLGWSPHDVVVGMASRLIPQKGHDALFEAVARGRRECPSLVLSVFGDGPLRAELEARATAQLPGAVRFHGFVEDMAVALGGCDMLAFPTEPALREGFGLAALEAMASGLPVVATRVGSLPEVVGEDDGGVIVPPGDVEALEGALVALARDEGRRRRLGLQALRRARDRFSLEAMVDGVEAVYHEALAVPLVTAGARPAGAAGHGARVEAYAN